MADKTDSKLDARVSAANATLQSDRSKGIAQLREIIFAEGSEAETIKAKEQAIGSLTNALAEDGQAQSLEKLLAELKPLYDSMAKAKTAKIVRTVIDALARIPNTAELQIRVCKEQIEWARQEKRNFLRQRIEMRLANLLMEVEDYQPALQLVDGLLTEVKKLDDKLLLVDVHLIESRLHHVLVNTPKSKAALTAARTAANAVYVPPGLQAEIDLQSGILNAEEKDYQTSYSYFFEAFEQYNNLSSPKALMSLKCMLLCKIMSDQADEVAGLVSSKSGLKYMGPDLEAMQLVAKARSQSSLEQLKSALRDYSSQLSEDPVVKRHLDDLFKALLEQNLVRIIRPYSKVQVQHLAKLITLDPETVEREVSQMILDKKIAGILDQGTGCLEIFDELPEGKAYPAAIDVVRNMGPVVDALFARSQRLVV